MKGARTRELVIDKSFVEYFTEIMFFMDINLREIRPGANHRFVIIRYVCGEKKQQKMLIASAKMFKEMRA